MLHTGDRGSVHPGEKTRAHNQQRASPLETKAGQEGWRNIQGGLSPGLQEQRARKHQGFEPQRLQATGEKGDVLPGNERGEVNGRLGELAVSSVQIAITEVRSCTLGKGAAPPSKAAKACHLPPGSRSQGSVITPTLGNDTVLSQGGGAYTTERFKQSGSRGGT